MLRGFLAACGGGVPPALRSLFVGGEALPGDLAQEVMRVLPGCRLHHFYGPTEAAIAVTHHEWLPGSTGVPPIGSALGDSVIELRDGQDDGEGEIWIAGTQLARGYHNRPQQTAAAFVTDRDGRRFYRTGDLARRRGDGSLVFLGRRDRQMNVGGVRIEAGEIEACLARVPGVEAAVAGLSSAGAGAGRLTAWIQRRPGAQTGAEEIRALLAETLPPGLIPSRYVWMDAFPRTASGKIDREALPAPARQRPLPDATHVPPATASEKRLEEIWRAHLDLECVGIDDAYFELGGDSLGLMNLRAAVAAAFGCDLQVADFFDRPTIRLLAQKLDETGAPGAVADSEARAAAGRLARARRKP